MYFNREAGQSSKKKKKTKGNTKFLFFLKFVLNLLIFCRQEEKKGHQEGKEKEKQKNQGKEKEIEIESTETQLN